MSAHRTRPSRPSSRSRHATWRSLAGTAGLLAILAIAACSGGSNDNGKASNVHVNSALPAIARGGEAGAGLAPQARVPGSESHDRLLANINPAALGRSQIKTARISLRSDQVASVVANIEQVATSMGGFVDSENTQTNTHGVATSSSVTIRVPVDDFDNAVDAVSRLGQLASRQTTTQDVTGRVADVNSRVASAKSAIAQLRVLFNRATKLGDIITLESQLSDRESDLEALQAQQRALNDQTTLSTIDVDVTRPPTTTTRSSHHPRQSGFVGGLQQGWNALVTTFRAVSHGLGAALPIGVVLIVLALLGWSAARRLPRHRPEADAAETRG
jgi:hypothetical protein